MREASSCETEGVKNASAARSPTGTSRKGGRKRDRYPGSRKEEPFTKTRLVRAWFRNQWKSFWRFWAGKAWPQICTRCYGQAKNNDKNSNDDKHKQDQAEAVVSYCLPQEDDPKTSRKLGGTWPEHLRLHQSEGPILRPVSGTTSPGLPTAAPAGLVLLDNLAAKVIYFSSNIFLINHFSWYNLLIIL